LLELHEFRSFRVQKRGQEVRRRHMKWFHLPIADASIPDETFERVLTSEPPTNGNVLLGIDLPNFIVTPHIAWASQEAMPGNR